MAAIQLLKFARFSPIITYASGHHADFLKGLGATDVIDRKSVAIGDLPSEVKNLTGGVSVKLVYDAVSAPDTQEAGYEIVAAGGHLVVVLDPQIKNPVESKEVHYIWGNVTLESNRPFGRVLYSKLTNFLEDGTIVVCRIVLFINSQVEAESYFFQAKQG